MEIKVGDLIPAIVLKDQNGNLFDLKVKTAGKSIVLFFYPKDDNIFNLQSQVNQHVEKTLSILKEMN